MRSDFIHWAPDCSQGLLISSCLFAPSVPRWLLPWFSCPGSWPGLWGHWGCWWEHRGTGQNGTPAEPSLAPGRLDAVPVLAGAQFDALIEAVSLTSRCDLVCRQPARPSVCLHQVWQKQDFSSGSGHTKAAAEPGRNKHACFSWLGLSARREEEEQDYATAVLQGCSWWCMLQKCSSLTLLESRASDLKKAALWLELYRAWGTATIKWNSCGCCLKHP